MMKCLKNIIIVVVVLSGCATVKNSGLAVTTLPATALMPFGRTVINEAKALELISSAAHFGFSFEGSECTIAASTSYGHNYLQYELDGKYQKRIKVSANSQESIVLSAPKHGKHMVWIYKATEAHTGPIVIKNITGRNLKPLQVRAAPLIEFIGNSITCGAAADASEVPCGAGEYHDQHNAYYAYGVRVARALKTNFLLSSVSGIGIYRNWNSDGPAMLKVFEKVDFQDSNSELWNFKRYEPKIVSIALGTNDLSKGDGNKMRLPFDSSSFIKEYVKFIRLIKSKYPAAQIALLSSPMIGALDRLVLQNCLLLVKKEIDVLYPLSKTIALHFFKPMKPHGCSGHPSIEDHQIIAEELIPFFKQLL